MKISENDLGNLALEYRNAGLSIIPTCLKDKQPDTKLCGKWGRYKFNKKNDGSPDQQGRLPTEVEIDRWFPQADSLALVNGKISGNLETLDFDLEGGTFEPWKEKIKELCRMHNIDHDCLLDIRHHQ